MATRRPGTGVNRRSPSVVGRVARLAVLLALGALGAAAAWVFTQGRPPKDVLGELVARLRGGTGAPRLDLPAHLRPKATPLSARAPVSFLPAGGAAPQPRELVSGLDTVEDLAWSGDGRFLVSAGYGDYSIRVWDVATGAAVQAFRTHHRPKGLAVLPGAKGILASDVYGHLRFYPWHESGRLGWGRAYALEKTVGEIAVSPDGRLVASGLWHAPESGELVVLATDGAAVLARAALPSGLRRPAFSPSGRWLAIGDSGRTFTLWDLTTGKGSTHLVPKVDVKSDVGTIDFSHDEQYLATGHMDSSITVWSLDGPRQRHNFYVSQASAWRVAFSPREPLLATAHQGGNIHLWDPATARSLAVLRGHAKGAREIAWSPDGRLLASSGEDGKILIWGQPQEAAPPAPAEAGTTAETGRPPAPPAEMADIVRLLATVRGMPEIPEDQRRALGEAADRLPSMSEQERAAFAASLLLITESRKLSEALVASAGAALGLGTGPALDLGLDSAFLEWNLAALPEAQPVVEGLRALARGDTAAIASVLTKKMRERFASEDPERALAEMRERWQRVQAAVGPGPVHITFVGTSTHGEIHMTSASGSLSKEGLPGRVDVPAVPIVKEEGAWRIGEP